MFQRFTIAAEVVPGHKLRYHAGQEVGFQKDISRPKMHTCVSPASSDGSVEDARCEEEEKHNWAH